MASYYMVGGDGKEYGPATAEQLRQWVAEGRANLQTIVRPVDGGLPVALGTVPELNPAASAPVYTTPPAAATAGPAYGASAGADYFMRGGDGKEYGPVSAAQLRQWVAEGRANAQTIVRPANGGPYIALGLVPELSGAAASPRPQMSNLPLAQALAQGSGQPVTDTHLLVKKWAGVLAQSAGWMKFLAILFFLSGAGYVMSIWLIVLAWIPIWQGVVLWNAATAIERAAFTGEEADMTNALDRFRFYFKLSGALRLVTFGLAIFGFILFFGFIAAFASHMPHMQGF